MGERGPEGIKITMDKLTNSTGKEGVRKGELSKYAEKRSRISQPLDEKGYLGPDYDRFLRGMVVDVAIGLIELEDKKRDGHESEVDSASESLIRSRFGVGTVSEFKNRIEAENYNSGAVERSYERLTKSVKLFLNKKGFNDSDLSKMTEAQIDAQLFSNFEGIGSAVKEILVVDGQLKTVLKRVDNVLNRVEILDQGRKKKMDIKAIDSAMKKTEEILLGEAMGNDSLKKQSELVIDYLTILGREIEQGKGDTEVEDCIVSFIGQHILRKGLTLDDNGELKSTNGDDFELLENGRDENGNRKYKNPETVKWIERRKENMEDLIMIVSNGDFSDIREIDAVLNNENEYILDDYIKAKYAGIDLDRGKKSDLLVIKDQLGRWFCDAIRDGGDKTNRTVLGTLNAFKIENLLPMEATGLGVDIVVNVSNDVLIRKALRRVCGLDMDGSFVRIENHDGFSSVETKESLKREIKLVIEKITNDNKRYVEGDDTYRSEVEGLVGWLNNRVRKYDMLIARQVSLGKYGEKIPGEPEKTEERLQYARNLLDYVEESDSPPGSLNIMDQCTRLFEMLRLDCVEQEIKDEIHARIHLAFMYYHMHAAGGLLNNRGQSIEDAHEQGFREKRLIDKITVAFLLKKGANGLPVAECWDAIEELNFGWENGKPVPGNESYYNLLVKMMGVNYSFDNTTGRIIFKLEYKNKIDKKTGMVVRDKKGNIVKTNEVDYESPTTKAVFKPLIEKDADGNDVPTVEGKYLLSFREQGMQYLNQRGTLTDVEYLSKWTNEMRFKFFKDFNKIQNKESLFWGEGSENAMRFNYFTDINPGRKGMVRDFILNRIKEKRDAENVGKSDSEKLITDKKSLEKGFELAEKLLEATAETSVFNPCFAGHNDFSELILTEANTKDRQKKMKVIGMRVAMADIVSFYTTWIRYIAGEKEADRRSVFKPLLAKEINIERMDDPKNDSYFLMTAILPKKILPVQAFFMKEDIGSKDVLTVEPWKKLYDPVTKVIGYSQDVLTDPNDDLKTIRVTDDNKEELSRRLRLLAVKVVLQSAVRPTSDFDWSKIVLLGNIVTKPYTTVDIDRDGLPGDEESFSEIGDWDALLHDEILSKEMEEKFHILEAVENAKKRDTIDSRKK